MNSKQPFCLMPFLHFHTSNNGDVRACCVANIRYGNINDESFEQIWQGDEVAALRQKFLKQEPDPRCKVCLQLEATGAKSIRQETFERFPNTIVNPNFVSKPTYFDIRFSNACNFSCRTCWHGASSGWYPDAKALNRTISNKAVIHNIPDFNKFINQLGPSLLQAKEIYFAGGEPLVTTQHYQLLNWLITNKATGIRLRYNTNFSILSHQQQSVIALWAKFTDVEIMASLDATEELGAYIRKGFSWSKFLENRQAVNHLPHLVFKIAPTISVFNIRHLPELYLESVRLNIITPNNFYSNILQRPMQYNVQALPAIYKETVNHEYITFFNQNQNLPTSVKKQFQESIDFMNSGSSLKSWSTFQKETKTFDDLRSETLSNILSFEI